MQQTAVFYESLILQTNGEIKTLFELRMGEGSWYWNNAVSQFRVMTHQSGLEVVAMPDFEGSDFRKFVASWRFYDLIPALMRQQNPATPQSFLQENGGNFSAWLLTLQRYPEFTHLKQAARDILPGLSDLVFEPGQTGGISVGSRESHLTSPITIQRMSNGELSFLALLSLIMAPEELAAPLYCIEEPESHLHWSMLESLVELLEQRQGTGASCSAGYRNNPLTAARG